MNEQVPLLEAKKAINQWRQTRTKQNAIPKKIWDLVIPLIEQYPLSKISKELGLSYKQLRSKMNPSVEQSAASNPFVSIDLPNMITHANQSLCKIQFSRPDGVTLVIDGANYELIQEFASYFMRSSC